MIQTGDPQCSAVKMHTFAIAGELVCLMFMTLTSNLWPWQPFQKCPLT